MQCWTGARLLAGEIRPGLDGVTSLRHLTDYDDPYAPLSIAVVPSGRW